MTELVTAAERSTEGIFRLELPYRPIDAVNVLVLPESDGLMLIDTGPGPEEYLSAIDHGLRQLGLAGVDDVHRIGLTHAHTDHIGQAGRIQERTGARMHAHPDAMEFFAQRYEPERNDDLLAWFRGHGFPSDLLDKVASTLPTRPDISPRNAVDYEDEIRIQGSPWLVIETGGHAPGHVVLYQPDRGLLLSGDAVLEDIVPLIDIQPFRAKDTMQLYLDGLRDVRNLDISLVLPAHGRAFANGRERIDELIRKHEDRITRVHQACAGQWRNAYEILEVASGRRIQGMTKLRMAFGQVIGYLGYLETNGMIDTESRDGMRYFRSVNAA